MARNVSKTLSSQSESENSHESANESYDDTYTKSSRQRRKPKKIFSPEYGQKRLKINETQYVQSAVPLAPEMSLYSPGKYLIISIK